MCPTGDLPEVACSYSYHNIAICTVKHNEHAGTVDWLAMNKTTEHKQPFSKRVPISLQLYIRSYTAIHVIATYYSYVATYMHAYTRNYNAI